MQTDGQTGRKTQRERERGRKTDRVRQRDRYMYEEVKSIFANVRRRLRMTCKFLRHSRHTATFY